jgi:hypothetical protein
MIGRLFRGKKFLAGLLLLALLAGAGVAWLERVPLRAWFYVRGLARAGESDRARWVGRVASLGEPAVPGLLGCLGQADPAVCANARAGLARLGADWGPDDPRTADLAGRLGRGFGRLSPAGQRAALELALGWLPEGGEGPGPSEALVAACARLLVESAGAGDPDVQAKALGLGRALLARTDSAEAFGATREVVRAALQSEEPANRLAAIRLTLLYQEQIELIDQVVALLRDPDVGVRRAAMLAVARAEQVGDESLLPGLHDPDAEVRRLCEEALSNRGLGREHIELGRLLTDPRPATRLRVLDRLPRVRDIDPALWLRRLTHDPSPHVRFTAMRVISEQADVDLSDRLDQMARSDPSPSVSYWADYYLRRARAGRNAP